MGVLPTPANYFNLFNSEIHHSIQITGSHNPSEYNGFKISFNKKPYYGESIQKLKNTIIWALNSQNNIKQFNVIIFAVKPQIAKKIISKSLESKKNVFVLMQNRYSPPLKWIKRIIEEDDVSCREIKMWSL